MTAALAVLQLILSLVTNSAAAARWPKPRAVPVPQASGFVVIPRAAVPIRPGRIYKAVFDATRAADKPAELLPALDNAGSELNGMEASHQPTANMKLVVVFHGAALDGILDDAHYRAKFGIANPNLPVLRRFSELGVKLFVCGQNLAFANIDPAALAPQVEMASDALIVLMTYESSGYALLSF